MTKRKYARNVEKPLSQIMSERRDYYLGIITEAVDAVYNNGNFERIEKFEKSISILFARSTRGKVNLEEIVKEETLIKIPVGSKTRVAKGTRLTYYQFAKARDEGMTNAEIKETFRLDTPYQLIGLGMRYSRENKEKGK